MDLPSWDDDSISAFDDHVNVNTSRRKENTMLSNIQHMQMQMSTTDTLPSTINPIPKVIATKQPSSSSTGAAISSRNSNHKQHSHQYQYEEKEEEELFTTREYLLLNIDKIKI